MKILKTFLGSVLVCLMLFSACFAAAGEYKAKIQSKRINAGTVLKLKLTDALTTIESQSGDMFSAMLTEDLIANGQMVLPRGTIFRGNIVKVVPSRRLSRGAVLFVDLDHVVTPTGKQLPVKVGLCSDVLLTVDGGIKAGGNYGYALQKNWDKSTDIMGKAIDWGSNAGDNFLSGYPKYILIPAGIAGGTIGGISYFVGDSIVDLFRKGENVVYQQGSTMNFLLTAPLDIPVN